MVGGVFVVIVEMNQCVFVCVFVCVCVRARACVCERLQMAAWHFTGISSSTLEPLD